MGLAVTGVENATAAAGRLPALFIGHGSPMNAIEDSEFALKWEELGRTLPRPQQILVVSAHWYVPRTEVTVQTQPETIHDFGPRFPRQLQEKLYPAPGSPALAQRVRDLLSPAIAITPNDDNAVEPWGLDHGAWSILARMYPDADIPVVELSVNSRLANEKHYELGALLAPLRDEGTLILASGSLVHNLGDNFMNPAAAAQYAPIFNEHIEENLAFRGPANKHPLVNWDRHPLARRAHPTPEHYLPLLYILGVGSAAPEEPISKLLDGYDGPGISMLSARVG